jgi:hypothetical protein
LFEVKPGKKHGGEEDDLDGSNSPAKRRSHNNMDESSKNLGISN